MNLRISFLLLLMGLLPFIFMVAVNEQSRGKTGRVAYDEWSGPQGAINPYFNSDKKKCAWICYQSTAYCKKNHVKVLKPFFSVTDPVYFGIIRSLNATNHYVSANIIVLMFLWPLVMWLLLRKVIINYFKIKKLKETSE